MQNTWRNFVDSNPRFHMARAVDVSKNDAKIIFADDDCICVLVEAYCLMMGEANWSKIDSVISELPDYTKYFNIDKRSLEGFNKYFDMNYETYHRFLMKKTKEFDFAKLRMMVAGLDSGLTIKKINPEVIRMMANDDSYASRISMIDGEIGFVCVRGSSVVGSIVTDIRYEDSVELNIRVNDGERGKGVAKALAATMIEACIDSDLFPIWDAANITSRGLALKLGYKIETEYDVYAPLLLQK